MHYYPVVITHSGLVLNTAAAALQECGVTRPAADKAVRRLGLHMLQYDIKFKKARNHIERQRAAAPDHGDPG